MRARTLLASILNTPLVLAARVQSIGGLLHISAAAAKNDTAQTLHVHSDLVGSSLFLEAAGYGVDGYERQAALR